MSLPYENATSGKQALNDLQAMLRQFGATSFGVMEEYELGEIVVQFVWHGRRVSLKASYKGYAAAWLRQHPYTSRMRVSRVDHERRALLQANISVCSVLRDWIKGQVVAIETGMLSFESAFLGQILLANGESVLERVVNSDMLALPPPH